MANLLPFQPPSPETSSSSDTSVLQVVWPDEGNISEARNLGQTIRNLDARSSGLDYEMR
jgi:hypothetical protein